MMSSAEGWGSSDIGAGTAFDIAGAVGAGAIWSSLLGASMAGALDG